MTKPTYHIECPYCLNDGDMWVCSGYDNYTVELEDSRIEIDYSFCPIWRKYG